MELDQLTDEQLEIVNNYCKKYVRHKEEVIQDWTFHLTENREVEYDELTDTECGDEQWFFDCRINDYYYTIEGLIDKILEYHATQEISVLTPNGKVVEIQ